MASSEQDPAEDTPPALQQRFFRSTDIPPRRMRDSFPQVTREGWSVSHGSGMSQRLTENQEGQDPVLSNFLEILCMGLGQELFRQIRAVVAEHARARVESR
jgi:hypothetical protein|eukprot:3748206-Prymnesium_polylepis.1